MSAMLARTKRLYPAAAAEAVELWQMMERLNAAAEAVREYAATHTNCTCNLCRWMRDTYVGDLGDDLTAIAVTVPSLTANVLSALPGSGKRTPQLGG